MIESNETDAQYQKGFLKSGYDKYHKKIIEYVNNYPRMKEYIESPTFKADQLNEAQMQHLMGLRIPFIIKDGAKHLKMMDWDLDYFADNFGDCVLPINTAPDKPNKDISLSLIHI